MSYHPQNLRLLREKAEMTQTDLANKISLTRNNIDSYESGTFPKIDVANKICALFEITLDQFFNKDLSGGSSTPPTPHAGYTGTEDNKPIPQKTYGHATFEEKDEEITAWLGVPGDLGTLFTPGQALLFRAMVEKIRDLEAKLNVRKS